MSPPIIATLALLGAVGGFGAGLLGFGGGVLMFPLLFYVPPLIGIDGLDAQSVAAVVIAEVFFATLVGGAAHWRRGRVQSRLTLVAGAVSAAGSFLGGIASKWATERFLLSLFGVVALVVVAMTFFPAPSTAREETPASEVDVPLVPLSLFSWITGVVVGFLGAGNFVFVPLLIYAFKVPTRIAIGSSLFVAMLNTSAGFLAKLVTAQIPLPLALAVIAGAAIGALAGERTHSRIPVHVLRYAYTGMVGLITVRVWLTLLGMDGSD